MGNSDQSKPRRYFLFDADKKGRGSIIADDYITITFDLFQPAGHHFSLGGKKIAYFPFDVVNYVTSNELEPGKQDEN